MQNEHLPCAGATAPAPATEIPQRVGQAVESREPVPLLARALERPASTHPSPAAGLLVARVGVASASTAAA